MSKSELYSVLNKQLDAVLIDLQTQKLQESLDEEDKQVAITLIAKQIEIAQLVVTKEAVMSKIEVGGDAGVVAGPGSHVHDVVFVKKWAETAEDIDIKKLASELAALRQELKTAADSPEQDAAVGAVANAEVAAKDGDGPGVLEWLKNAGEWVLEVAEKIAVPLAVAALKAAAGL